MFQKRHPKAGARPGTLVIHEQSPPPVIHVIEYTPDSVKEYEIADVEELRRFLNAEGKVWVDVQGFGDEKIIRAIGDLFGMHPLALEDVVNLPQRPKIESYDNHLLWITRMVMMIDPHTIRTEQVGMVLGSKYLLTFQEKYGDVLDSVRDRLREGLGPMRKSGHDYLAYAIIDAVIDGYYPILEAFGETIEDFEDEIVKSPDPGLLQKIHRIKRELLAIRRAVWPQREALNKLIRDESEYVSDHVRTYLRDVYDHCIQIIDVVETYRELAGGLMEVYLSSVGNRQNEVMKVLTIMASIFIPLTFMAGIYGMNFEYMPELHIAWGYPVLLIVMAIMAAGMTIYFRRKRWL